MGGLTFILLGEEGKVVYESGEGSPIITVQKVEHTVVGGPDGQSVSE